MGNTSSSLSDLSKEDVARAVASHGAKFEVYANAVRDNGIDGEILADLQDEKLCDIFDELGIASKLHRKVLSKAFAKARQQGNASPAGVYESAAASKPSSRHSSTSSPSTSSWSNDPADSSTPTASASSSSATMISYGRRGDIRMNKAVEAKLADPEMTLLEALQKGGFKFDFKWDQPHMNDSKVLDEENKTLRQRKNQLSRRLKKAIPQQTGATPTVDQAAPSSIPDGMMLGTGVFSRLARDDDDAAASAAAVPPKPPAGKGSPPLPPAKARAAPDRVGGDPGAAGSGPPAAAPPIPAIGPEEMKRGGRVLSSVASRLSTARMFEDPGGGDRTLDDVRARQETATGLAALMASSSSRGGGAGMKGALGGAALIVPRLSPPEAKPSMANKKRRVPTASDLSEPLVLASTGTTGNTDDEIPSVLLERLASSFASLLESKLRAVLLSLLRQRHSGLDRGRVRDIADALRGPPPSPAQSSSSASSASSTSSTQLTSSEFGSIRVVAAAMAFRPTGPVTKSGSSGCAVPIAFEACVDASHPEPADGGSGGKSGVSIASAAFLARGTAFGSFAETDASTSASGSRSAGPLRSFDSFLADSNSASSSSSSSSTKDARPLLRSVRVTIDGAELLSAMGGEAERLARSIVASVGSAVSASKGEAEGKKEEGKKETKEPSRAEAAKTAAPSATSATASSSPPPPGSESTTAPIATAVTDSSSSAADSSSSASSSSDPLFDPIASDSSAASGDTSALEELEELEELCEFLIESIPEEDFGAGGGGGDRDAGRKRKDGGAGDKDDDDGNDGGDDAPPELGIGFFGRLSKMPIKTPSPAALAAEEDAQRVMNAVLEGAGAPLEMGFFSRLGHGFGNWTEKEKRKGGPPAVPELGGAEAAASEQAQQQAKRRKVAAADDPFYVEAARSVPSPIAALASTLPMAYPKKAEMFVEEVLPTTGFPGLAFILQMPRFGHIVMWLLVVWHTLSLVDSDFVDWGPIRYREALRLRGPRRSLNAAEHITMDVIMVHVANVIMVVHPAGFGPYVWFGFWITLVAIWIHALFTFRLIVQKRAEGARAALRGFDYRRPSRGSTRPDGHVKVD